jgi:hypothetical protein
VKTAREVLTEWVSKHDTPYLDEDMGACADLIIAALARAGYHILNDEQVRQEFIRQRLALYTATQSANPAEKSKLEAWGAK